jgi:Spy/CpxP family protein refolding chaperone
VAEASDATCRSQFMRCEKAVRAVKSLLPNHKKEETMKNKMLSLVLTVFLAVPAFAEMNEMCGPEHAMEHGHTTALSSVDKMEDMLKMCIEHADMMGLTDEQLVKIKPVHRKMQIKQVKFDADLKIADIELAEIMEVKKFDLQRASSAVKRIAEIKTAYHLEMLREMETLRTILTDEQFKKIMAKRPCMDMHEKKPAHKMMKNQGPEASAEPGLEAVSEPKGEPVSGTEQSEAAK